MRNKALRGEYSVFRDTRANKEPKWKRWRIVYCLKGQYIANLGEEGMLGDMKEYDQINSETFNRP
jgi:hypothetical protein